MNEQQQTAFVFPCRLGIETVHPRFAHKGGTHSLVLTVNNGYE